VVAQVNRHLSYLILLFILGSIVYSTFETAAPMTWGDPDDTGFSANSTACSGNTPPTANPGTTYTSTEGSPILFDGSASHDPDGDNLTYNWAFGDNTTDTGRQIHHTYLQEGTYCVALTVHDPFGACDRSYIRAIIQNSQPIANFSASTYHGVAPLTITFTDTSLSQDGIHSWLWDFGDNTTSHNATSSHTYTRPGSYAVTLTVTEADLDQDVTDTPIWINVTTTAVTEPERHAPTLAIIDAVSATQPGSSATYTLTLTNNDPSTVNASIFALESTLPTNWTGILSDADITIPPGRNQSFTFMVTPPITTLPQRYNLTLTVWNTAAPNLSVTTTLSLLVQDPSESIPPTDEMPPSDNSTIPENEDPSPQNVTIHLTPDMPTTDDFIDFTITTPQDNDTIIRIYVDDTLIHQNVSTGNYTYQAGPFPEGNHTYFLEAEDDEGAIIRDPPNGTKLLSIDPPSIGLPTIPWYLFLLPILALILLNSVSQYLNNRNAKNPPSQPPSPPPSPTSITSAGTDSTESDPALGR
jgi:PKD repeat protein